VTAPDQLAALLAEAALHEVPPASLCLQIAHAFNRAGAAGEAGRWAAKVVDAGDDFGSWQGAAAFFRRNGDVEPSELPPVRRSIRLAVLGSYTTSQLTALLPLAARRLGIALAMYECDYGQYRQEIIDPSSGLYRFEPDVILLAVHAGDLALPTYSEAPEADAAAELGRWTALWGTLRERSRARVVQHNFALPVEAPFGHLGMRLAGTRHSMARRVNDGLGREAGDGISVVDLEWLSSVFGKRGWFDPRYWHLSKQAVSLAAVPMLARHTMAVVAAELGLSRKCVVLDLDNTLWGGVIGEDGLEGIHLGDGPAGEAYVAFQEYLLSLRDKGILLAVCSKNDDATAREPFERHPGMRLKLDDIAVFSASWQPKPDQLRTIAGALNIAVDSLVFVDDNPLERQAMRRLLPEVDVVPLPDDPAGYVRGLSDYLGLETAAFTAEDAGRTAQYRARAEVASLQASASSMDEFLASLGMQTVIEPFDTRSLPRVAQLVAKTNQFNLTTRRYNVNQLEAFSRDPSAVHFSVRLRDHFADHGLIALLIGFVREEALDIDTWLMSCRVIGRSVEQEMVAEVARRAAELGCSSLLGTYIPTPKNGMVRDLYSRLGFVSLGGGEEGGSTRWCYDLRAGLPPASPFISIEEPVA
jgi:FkbH-like protein